MCSKYIQPLAACSLLINASWSASAAQPRTPTKTEKLEQFLRTYITDEYTPKDTSAQYIAANVPNSNMIIAYLDGRYLCGTSGCSTLILQPHGNSYGILGTISIHWPPIRLLSTKHHGMPDFSVWVQGGGVQPGYQAAVRFDGKDYSNPTTPPSRRISAVLGRTLIPEHAKLKPLYR